MPPSFAPASANARSLHVVASDDLHTWRAAQPAQWQAWLDSTGFEAGLGDIRLLPGPDGQVAAAVTGLGKAKARARQRFGLAKAVAQLPAGDWALQGNLGPDDATEAALGWLLGTYTFNRYRPGKPDKDQPRLVAPQGVDAPRIEAMAAAEFLTRDLINTPAADMGPQELQDAFMALAARFGAKTDVIIGDDLLAQNFPMVHAVGRAATRAPRIMSMTWEGPGGSAGPAITLVGKGVCFDTGGLDLKPSAGMLLMKKDMGGAATVLGLAQMIMALNLPIRLRVIIPAVENAVSGNAMRPRDILTSRKGLTVEINNTDAEGRLILADALAWADEEKPDLVISMATLTGAARVAVGPDLAPFFTDDEALAQGLQAAATKGFDPVWRLPFWEAYEPLIEPGIADLDNAPSGGFAGAITAALFLRRFVTARYMHFDIYGHQPSDAPGRPKGGVGQSARALLGLIEGLARG
ncbi:MAG: leucyl aminopeptidase family protein [Paracoccaceae bacterium]